MIKKTFFVFVAMVIACTGAHFVYADDLVITGSNSFTGTTGIPKAINDLQITGTTPSTTPIKLRVTHGTLSISTTTGLTMTSSTTGSVLEFSGSIANINAALATLTYTRVGTGSDTIEVSLVNPGEVFFSGTNHLYEYIPSTLTWTAAKTAAEALTRYGATGYLATITSSGENQFVSDRLGGAGWMGASDATVEGSWRWVTGPENGTTFWLGNIGGAPVDGNYSNWNTSEPNDSSANEDCGQFLAGGSGKWNDLPCTVTTLAGYVVEFGAPGNMPTVVSKNITINTTTGPLAPMAATATNPTQTTFQIEWNSAEGAETNFIIEQSQSDCSGSFSQIGSVSSTITTYTATDLSPDVRYCFRVKSTDGVTSSSYSTTASDFTLANTPLKPTISSITETSMRVTLPTDGNSVGVTEASLYSVQEATRLSYVNYPSGSLIGSEPFTSLDAWNNISVTGLTPNTPYSFRTRIAQRNSGGGLTPYSPVSDVVYTLASIPTSLSVISKSQTTGSLSWNGNGTSYIVTNTTTGATIPVTEPSKVVSGLSCGTTYTFRVQAINHDGVVTEYSEPITLITDQCSSGSGSSVVGRVNNLLAANNTTAAQNLINEFPNAFSNEKNITAISSGNYTCPSDQLLTQNLKAPARDGKYNSYTKAVVTDVKILQAHLNRLGFDSGKVDGILGVASDKAIKKLQMSLGTKPDGMVGTKTRTLLNNSCKI